MSHLYKAISLGNTCQAKLQIARKLNSLMASPMSEMALRLHLAPPLRGRRTFGWDLFDYQVTPFYVVNHFLEVDFEGVYEREDLEPRRIRIGSTSQASGPELYSRLRSSLLRPEDDRQHHRQGIPGSPL